MTRSGGRRWPVRWWTIACGVVLLAPARVLGWGGAGHALVVRAALAACDDLPPWFRTAGDRLAELANAPDRWREVEGDVPALAARAPDHFFDLDVWGRERLPPERWAYVRRATRRGLVPEDVGFLPYALLEEYGILVSALRDVRASRPGGRETALVAAGVLAHLVGDAAVPLHLTRHHHGWVGRNPEGFTRAKGVHHWFETKLVEDVRAADVRAAPEASHGLRDVRAAVETALAESLAAVPRLYRLERDTEADPAPARALARERLAAGATLLARLWRTAWLAGA